MAIYKEDIVDIELSSGTIYRSFLNRNIGEGDQLANRFGVRLLRNGEPESISGTCSGYFIRPDGGTVVITGTISGNTAYVDLPQTCYTYEGQFALAIKITSGSATGTMRIIDGVVSNTTTDTLVDPGTILPSIESLIASIEAAVDTIPLDYSALSDGFRDAMQTEYGLSDPGTFSSYTIKKSDGTTASSTAYKITDFMPVIGGTLIYTTSPALNSTVLNERASIAFYSSASAAGYISSEDIQSGEPQTIVWQASMVPSGAKYFRIMIGNTLTDQFKCIQIETLDGIFSKSIKQVSSWEGSPYSTLADLPDNTICRTTNAPDRPYWQIASAGLFVMTLQSPGTNNRTQVAFNGAAGSYMMRYAFDAGKTYSDWIGLRITTVLTTQANVTSWGGENDAYASLKDLPANSFFRTYNAPDRPDGQGATAGFWVMTLKTEDATYWAQVGFGASTGIMVMRHRASSSADYSSWTYIAGQKKQIRVLCIGNSYTQDNMSYVPFIMKRVAPDIDLTLGMSYYSGARIDQYIDFFDNDTRVLMYSKINSADTAWTTWGINTTTPQEGQKTIKEILADEPWDIITIQQGSAYMASWSTFTGLNTWIDKIISYERSQGLRHVRIGWLMPQMRKPQEYISANYTFENMIDCVQKVIATSPCSFVIPCGTAIENARGTSLDSLGAYSSDAPDGKGHLCYDTNGHLQEGLPCLCGAYAATLKLLELFGMPYIGILAENTSPNDTWLSGKNIPIAHGSAVGVSEANCYLAQKCAVAAVKNMYEVTPIT